MSRVDDEEAREGTEALERRVAGAVAALGPAYLENRRGDVGRIRALCAAGDLAGVALLAHRMRGTGASYGFARVTELGAEMEEAAESGDAPAVLEGARRLEAFLAEARVP